MHLPYGLSFVVSFGLDNFVLNSSFSSKYFSLSSFSVIPKNSAMFFSSLIKKPEP